MRPLLQVEELAWVIHSYGEDDDPFLSKRIAMMQLVYGGNIPTTKRLAEIIRQAKKGTNDKFKKKEANAVRRFVCEHEEPDAFMQRVAGERKSAWLNCSLCWRCDSAGWLHEAVRVNNEAEDTSTPATSK